MQKVLTAAEMREVDRLTTERYGIPSIILMENAAHAVARVITEKLGGSVKGKRILILCGKGNNGGDGAALARILWTNGASIYLVLFGNVIEIKGDARTNFDSVATLAQTGYRFRFEQVNRDEASSRDWFSEFIYDFAITRIDAVVDSIFGTGFRGPLEGPMGPILETFWSNLNRRFHEIALISVDLPTGLGADESRPNSWHFFPDTTVTFTSPKAANALAPASRFNGELIVASIGSPQELIDEQPSQLYLAEREDAATWLERTGFSSNSYKNKRGHALLIAGSENYAGAAVLAANAAMRSGVGLVTLACPADTKTEIASRILPEVILQTLDPTADDSELKNADAIAVGCGLDANNKAIESFVRKLVEERTTPVIVDAGALWFFNAEIAENHPDAKASPLLRKEGSDLPPLILTPHEGEFLRLLGDEENHPVGETPPPHLRKEGSKIKDRVAAVREFAQTHDVILVLKGERVLIGHPDGRVVVNPTGNSGLGKAGNGDTLAGILAGFVAQAAKMEIDIFETVVAAVYIAGMAGDIAEKKFGKRVMTASDVRECLTEVFAELEKD
ncbi:MAG: NAD(P)H-hydrate dehydratase [Acidobacteria bacterium]|nr:NAD(P)H-hydrate dehydratase [Acidobacteriota bacterium]